ncbi:DUF799 domain-containing protein [uncultured Castellaniella sp.]|uniref:DUF799 domain-containing protein n=1 Tax=uncultured Castellaniella sp. TaxID=647907 RepID=UPI00260D17DC|nr:DUF799 domain-containing protein [uncultured Castellaniella sp.]
MTRTLYKHFRLLGTLGVILLTGCAAPQQQVDYTAFRESRPASILVLPPLNESLEVQASNAVLAQATLPLAESGYYVVPVAVMAETFRQNGLTTPADIQELPAKKLHDIFGADAALYMTVKNYGSSYAVISSTTRVSIDAELIDLRSGAKLWAGHKELAQSSGSGGGLIGMLVNAVVTQIANNLSDQSYHVAGTTNLLLLSAGQQGGILYGPRSAKYELR